MAALETRAVTKIYHTQGADVRASSPAEARQFIANEIERWGQVIRPNDIRADS